MWADAKMVPGFCGGGTGCGEQVEAQQRHTEASLTVRKDQRLVGAGASSDRGGGVDQGDDQALEAQDRSQLKTTKRVGSCASENSVSSVSSVRPP